MESEERSYTLAEIIEKVGFGKFQLLLVLICGIIQASDAMEMLILAFLSRTLQCDWRLSASQVALLTTFVFVGMLIGAPMLGSLSDKYGRWNCLFFSAVGIAYYGAITAAVPNYVWMLICRAFVGFFIGGLLAAAATLISEFMPNKYRAKFLTVLLGFWTFGGLFEVGIAKATLGVTQKENSWRWLLLISSIPVILCVVLFFWVPKSPRFLLGIGRPEEAKKVINRIARFNGASQFTGKFKEEKVHERGTLKSMFANRTYTRLTLLLSYLWFACGFLYYGIILLSVEITITPHRCLQNFGQSSQPHLNKGDCCSPLTDDDYITLTIATFGEFFGATVQILFIDSLGRRKLMMVLLMILSVLFIAFQFCMPIIATNIFLLLPRSCLRHLQHQLRVHKRGLSNIHQNLWNGGEQRHGSRGSSHIAVRGPSYPH